MKETFHKATIAVGQTVSDELTIEGVAVTGLVIPSDFDGTTVTFQVSYGDGNFHTLDGVSLTVQAGNAIGVPPGDVYGWRKIKIVTNVAAADDDSVIVVITKPL